MMTASKYVSIVLGILALSLGVPQAGATTLPQSVVNVVDTNPAHGVFEAELSADEQDVDIDGLSWRCTEKCPAVSGEANPVVTMIALDNKDWD